MRPIFGKYLALGFDDRLISCRPLFHRVAETPETFMGGYKPLHISLVPPLLAVERSVSHHLDHIEQPLGYLHVALVASLVERKKDLVREPPLMARAQQRLSRLGQRFQWGLVGKAAKKVAKRGRNQNSGDRPRTDHSLHLADAVLSFARCNLHLIRCMLNTTSNSLSGFTNRASN
jgi:hypothetical protein